MIWAEFAVCASLIFVSGGLLSRYGDALALKTGLGRTWIGLILLATVTSLPELATGLSAVTLAQAPNIAVGNVLGACVFNLMLVGLIDLFSRPEPVLSRVGQGHILSAGSGVLLMGMAGWGVLFGTQAPHALRPMLWLPTILILSLYLIAVRMVFRFERRQVSAYIKAEAEKTVYAGMPAGKIARRVSVNALIIIGAGTWLSFIGAEIADVMGWGQTFVGNVLVAVTTTLPEMVVSFTALRLGAPDLAIANLFGSNIFNLMILALDDIAYIQGPLFSAVSAYHLFSVVTALMMTGICITGLVYRTEKKALRVLGWDSAALLLLYMLNAFLLFVFTRQEIGP